MESRNYRHLSSEIPTNHPSITNAVINMCRFIPIGSNRESRMKGGKALLLFHSMFWYGDVVGGGFSSRECSITFIHFFYFSSHFDWNMSSLQRCVDLYILKKTSSSSSSSSSSWNHHFRQLPDARMIVLKKLVAGSLVGCWYWSCWTVGPCGPFSSGMSTHHHRCWSLWILPPPPPPPCTRMLWSIIHRQNHPPS